MKRDARWYVYELIDPRDGEPFYIGKGCDDRIAAHEREAIAGVCSEKTKRINDIWSENLEVIRQKVAFFWDEQAAYDYESVRIAEYGAGRLTNVMPGGGVAMDYEPRAWTAMEAATQLIAKPNVLSLFALWLKGVDFSVSGQRSHVDIVQACLTGLFPSLLEKVQENREAFEKLAQGLRSHQVELCYGRP